MVKRLLVGRFTHPLLANLLKLGCYQNYILINWGSRKQSYRYNLLFTGIKRPFEILYLLFICYRFKEIVFHFIRKDFLIAVIPILLLFKIEIKLYFWGSDTNYKNIYYKPLLFFKTAVSIYCTSQEVKRRLEKLGFVDIDVVHFPSPNSDILRLVRQNKPKINKLDVAEISIVLGNNGRKEQQHIKLLEVLRNWNLRESVNVVHIPYSYMAYLDEEYLRSSCKKVFPNAEVMIYTSNFTNAELELMYKSNFYFNYQSKDALSTFLCEMLCAGVTCVVAREPKYLEFKGIPNLSYFKEIDIATLSMAHEMDSLQSEKFIKEYIITGFDDQQRFT